MSSDPAPFIPAKLDNANLTAHEFRVFCHISRRGECYASLSDMSDNAGVSKPTLRDALRTLERASMIEVERNPGTTDTQRTLPPKEWNLSALNEEGDEDGNQDQQPDEPPEESTPPKEVGDPKSWVPPPKDFRGDSPQDFGYPSKGNPVKGSPFEGAKRVSAADAPLPSRLRQLVDRISWEAEPLPDDHPVRWEYSSDDWRWIAAEWALTRLEEDELLNSHYRKRLENERRGKIASEWADEIRKLVDLDGYSRDDVRITLGWLLGTDNWWRRNRTIQSLGALRKKGDDGTTKFDKILQSALADYEQQQQDDPETIREEIEAGFADDERDAEVADVGGDSLPGEPEVDRGGFVW